MEHRITDLSATEKKVEFVFPATELEQKITETLKQFKKMVKLSEDDMELKLFVSEA